MRICVCIYNACVYVLNKIWSCRVNMMTSIMLCNSTKRILVKRATSDATELKHELQHTPVTLYVSIESAKVHLSTCLTHAQHTQRMRSMRQYRVS